MTAVTRRESDNFVNVLLNKKGTRIRRLFSETKLSSLRTHFKDSEIICAKLLTKSVEIDILLI